SPDTTRAPRGYEESGREYFFIGREVFESRHLCIYEFLEYGEYKGNMYDTSIQSTRDVLNSGKICIIDIEPNTSPSGSEDTRTEGLHHLREAATSGADIVLNSRREKYGKKKSLREMYNSTNDVKKTL
uniref:Guanylate kinase-like domain-containing protein n=1 Tax=Amphilophus citrinellus TaxID=61819 RepID=A0A3Q0RKG6_AMPCI